jgi:hypothetical protein
MKRNLKVAGYLGIWLLFMAVFYAVWFATGTSLRCEIRLMITSLAAVTTSIFWKLPSTAPLQIMKWACAIVIAASLISAVSFKGKPWDNRFGIANGISSVLLISLVVFGAYEKGQVAR